MITTTVSSSWLYVRCVLWGLATGAGAGAGLGAFLLGDYLGTVGGVASGALTGAVVGTLVALVPALIGAGIVTGAMHGSDDFTRSLGVTFAAVAAVINAACLVGIAGWGDGEGLLALLAADAGALPVLWWGWTSISKAAARA